MVVININKAKEIAHSIRREARSQEFKPLDELITINIANPTKVSEIELSRQIIRDKYTEIQVEIDSANTPEELKSIIETKICS